MDWLQTSFRSTTKQKFLLRCPYPDAVVNISVKTQWVAEMVQSDNSHRLVEQLVTMGQIQANKKTTNQGVPTIFKSSPPGTPLIFYTRNYLLKYVRDSEFTLEESTP
ncbi:hypothetical protein ILYODFUR_003161 [Ilyodon furcidens]|uniref:Uncharacterized protein n=1 Tax=Ilyodon furcidens TaxID=33524 RepID=A0ABV0TRF5_9TELE